MSEQASDHSNVIVFPPVVPFVTIALGFALQWLFPSACWYTSIGSTA